uniref:uncharacterized protein isoform X2 n=1 Tax=Semicossyphus pulcher TaxID=241346 RepID=UPI0037E9AD2E
MLGVKLIFFTFVAVKVTSNEIKTQCREFHDFPPSNNTSPSFLADLKVELVTLGGKDMLCISWAINIDASIEYLTATRIIIRGEPYHCEYNPPLAKADLTGSKQKWFQYLTKASYGSDFIQAANLPLPPLGSGSSYKSASITIPNPKQHLKPKTTQVPTEAVPHEKKMSLMIPTSPVFGCLASLMILSCCYIIWFPTSPTFPVPVLVVYPAENSAFQTAVVALAEFLQWQGGCSVAVDIWQQGKIAELGPMCWLAEQAKTASRVLIICPQPFSYPIHSTGHCLPAPSIPAAAQDLYPLVLNMVVSQAKSSKDFSKFWMVQLGEQSQYKGSDNLVPELRACKTFCIMKDLNKLCRSLHDHRQGDNKISAQILRSGIAYSEKSAVKLREAVKKINGHQSSILRDGEPLQSVVTTI